MSLEDWNCTHSGVPPTTSTDIIIGSMEAIIGTLITLLSLLVILSICIFEKLKTTHNYAVFNLAVADLCVGLSLGYLSAFYFVKELQLMKVPCLMRFILMTAVLLESSWTLVVISIERFIAVELPFAYTKMNPGKLKMSFVLTWVYSVCFSILPIVGWNTWTEEGCRCAMIDVLPVAYILTLAIHLLLMIIIMSVLYTKIFWTARKHMAKVGDIRQPDDIVTQGNRKATMMMLMVLGVFIITWLPFLLVTFVQAAMQLADHPEYANAFVTWIHIITTILGLTNSMWNPFIYATKNRDFRLAFKKILTCNIHERNLVHDTSSHT